MGMLVVIVSEYKWAYNIVSTITCLHKYAYVTNTIGHACVFT